MKSEYSRWLTGCGIGCAGLIVLVVVGGLGTFFYMRHAFQDFAGAETARIELRDRFGEIRDFKPARDGTIPAQRIEAFLQVRAATGGVRQEMQGAVRDLETRIEAFKSGRLGGLWAVLATIREGVGALPKLARLHQERSVSLLDRQMGPGEYEYIYVLAYYSWLHESPGDGPRFLKIGGNNDMNWDPENDVDDARVRREEEITRRVRADFRAILRNALAGNGTEAAALDPAWRSAVEKELAALDASTDRIPWQDGLPAAIEGSLAPYRSQFQASYDEINNALELIPLNSH